uniref:Ig-like domain-containing protein n=1 Tax=Paramormyrops kingsleyae TaxID=1676925 RepID=A0A3B3RE35_9TELE
MLFVDFSSAFNTIIPQQLVSKLGPLGISTPMCNWLLDFLTARPQSVRVGNNISSSISLSIGSPPGCVLSPLLPLTPVTLSLCSVGAARPTVSVSWVEGPSGDSALLCSVQDFYPESIEQVWLRDGLPLNVTPDRRSSVNPDGSYTLNSLSLTAAHAEDVLCSCWVNHSSLDLPSNTHFSVKNKKQVLIGLLSYHQDTYIKKRPLSLV